MTSTLWHERAAALAIDGRPFIGGQRVWAKSEQRCDNLSPVDGRNLGQVARCDGADADLAGAAARAAFEDRRWAGKSPAQRKRVLIRFADLVQQNGAALALPATLDTGKPIKYSQSVDEGAGADTSRWYGRALDKIYHEIAPPAAARRETSQR